MFDVSHMTIVDLHGARVREFLRYLLANDVAKLQDPGKALYTAMLNEAGGVIDDLIVYFMHETWFRLVVNAATRDKDLAWIEQQAAAYAVTVTEVVETAMIAVQGPEARQLAAGCIDTKWREQALALKPFTGMEAGELFVARTGYTGEDGWEIVVPVGRAETIWDHLLASRVAPCGLGARDTLRLEAAMNLYGSDMDETISPLEAGLGWTIAWEPRQRDFIGRARLEEKGRIPTCRALSACCSKTRACCATISVSWCRILARVRSRAAAFRRRSSVRSRWRDCRPATTTAPKSTCVANC